MECDETSGRGRGGEQVVRCVWVERGLRRRLESEVGFPHMIRVRTSSSMASLSRQCITTKHEMINMKMLCVCSSIERRKERARRRQQPHRRGRVLYRADSRLHEGVLGAQEVRESLGFEVDEKT